MGSVWMRLSARNFSDTVHGHMVYLEMVKQITPYMEMATIPMEYSGLEVDVLLVIAMLSLLWTVKVILGLFCDCCCPLKQKEQARKPQGNAIPNGQYVKGKKSSDGKKGKTGKATKKKYK